MTALIDLTVMVDGLGRSCPRLPNIHIALVRLSHDAVLALTASTLRKVLREAASGGRDAERVKLKLEIKFEVNAQEKFMRIKHAYNTLLNSESRKQYEAGNQASDYSYSTVGRNQSWNTQAEEEFYGFVMYLSLGAKR